MSRKPLWVYLILPFFLLSCRLTPVDSSSLSATRHSFKSRLDTYLSEDTSEGRNWTQQRVLDLNRYAQALIAEANKSIVTPALQARGLEDVGQIPAESVFLRQTDAEPGKAREDACFWENKALGQTTDRDLYYEFHYKTVAEQIEHAVRFMAFQYVLMDGFIRSNRSIQLNFKSIEICSVAQSGRLMNFNPHTGTLQISLLEDVVGTGYDILKFEDLQKYWNYGVQFSSTKSKIALSDNFLVSTARNVYSKVAGLENKMKIWQIVNPLGHFRVLLRQMLRESGDSTLNKIKEVLAGLEEEFEPEMLVKRIKTRLLNKRFGLVDQELANETLDADNGSVLAELTALSPQDLKSMLKRWAHFAGSPEKRSALEGAFMKSVAGKMNRLNARIKTKITGFVAVGNAHVINVDASLFSSHDYGAFTNAEKNVIANEVDVDIDAEVKGFVAVFTSDVVNVTVQIGSSFGTAGLVESLESVTAQLDYPEREL